MNKLYVQWKNDERAVFEGWNFSYLKNRMTEEAPPWDYFQEAKESISEAASLLDLGTAGGEALSSLAPLPNEVYATEEYKPNFDLAQKNLSSLKVKVILNKDSDRLPFENSKFDLVLSRHTFYLANEVHRVLKNKGVFLTQQVDGNNLDDLLSEFKVSPTWPFWQLKNAKHDLEKLSFKLIEAKEWSGQVEFKDVGALVYFLKAVPWIIKNFSVDTYIDILEGLQNKIDSGNKLKFNIKRFFIKAQK